MKLPKELSLAELAALTGGRMEGSPDVKVRSIALSAMHASEGDLAIVFEPKLVKQIADCRASIVVVPEGVTSQHAKIIVQRPLRALQKMLAAVQPRRYFPEPGIHPSAVVDPSAELGKDVAIGPCVVIGPKSRIGDGSKIMAGCVIGGEVRIGSHCLLYPGCLIADYVQIGDRVILQQGANLGSDGFGYVTENVSNLEKRMMGRKDLSQDSNPHLKIPQIGTVIVEDDVEIGSCATVARATMGATVIGKGSKIDNLVMIAHNARIGQEVLIVAQTAVAGSCVVGDRAIIAGHVGIKDHIRIGRDSIVEGKAGVMKDVPDEDVQVGIPAQPARDHMSQLAITRKLPEMYDELKALKRKVAQLEALLTERQLVGSKEG